MSHITTCTVCSKAYEESSEERAHEPDRLCLVCWRRRKSAHLKPAPFPALCRREVLASLHRQTRLDAMATARRLKDKGWTDLVPNAVHLARLANHLMIERRRQRV